MDPNNFITDQEKEETEALRQSLIKLHMNGKLNISPKIIDLAKLENLKQIDEAYILKRT